MYNKAKEMIPDDIYKSTVKRPFGYLRNFEWWFIWGAIGHDFIWIRVYPVPYGIEITKKTPLIGWLIFRDWKIRVMRAKSE